MITIPQSIELSDELVFQTSRSSGPGGQHVNKVNSRVTLKWDVAHSAILPAEQKELLVMKLSSRLTKEGVLLLSVQDSRSQLENKETALKKLDELLIRLLTPKKPRKATSPSRASKQKRIHGKKILSEKKAWRRKL